MRARTCLFLGAAVLGAAVVAMAACSSPDNSSGGGGSESGGTSESSGSRSGSSGAAAGSSSGTSESTSPYSGSSGSSESTGSAGSSGSLGSSSSASSHSSGSSGSAGSSGSSEVDAGSRGPSDAGSPGSADSSSFGSDVDAGSVDCTATLPDGGTTYTGSSVNGTADGLNYGIWATGSGGSITVFPNDHAFSASWSNVSDFLAHSGLDFDGTKSYTTFGQITAQFVEIKSGTAGSWSSIGMYGWMHSPCVEWYINEDAFNGLPTYGGTDVTIDGDVYTVTTSTTTGTGGANACEAGHTGSWTNMTSTRKTARQCGTVDVSAHFAAWAAQGWSLGGLASVHVNVEVGGGTGSIQFPLANVTTTSGN